MAKSLFETDDRAWQKRRREAEQAFEEAAQLAAETVGRAAHSARAHGDKALGRSVDYYLRGNRAVAAQLGDNVLPSLLLAAVAGYAVGWLLHSRR